MGSNDAVYDDARLPGRNQFTLDLNTPKLIQKWGHILTRSRFSVTLVHYKRHESDSDRYNLERPRITPGAILWRSRLSPIYYYISNVIDSDRDQISLAKRGP